MHVPLDGSVGPPRRTGPSVPTVRRTPILPTHLIASAAPSWSSRLRRRLVALSLVATFAPVSSAQDQEPWVGTVPEIDGASARAALTVLFFAVLLLLRPRRCEHALREET